MKKFVSLMLVLVLLVPAALSFADVNPYMALFEQELDKQGISYIPSKDGDVLIMFLTANESGGAFLLSAAFGIGIDEENEVEIDCVPILDPFTGANREKALEICNKYNGDKKFVSFCLSDAGGLTLKAFAYLDKSSCAAECVNLTINVTNAFNESYKEFSDILNGN